MFFSWKKAIGYGILMWVIMFAVVSGFIAFNVYANFWGKIVGVMIAGLVAYFLASRIKLDQVGKALGLGLVWVVVGLILDWVITARFNAEIFRMRSLWAGYCLTLLAPVIWSVFHRRPPQSQRLVSNAVVEF